MQKDKLYKELREYQSTACHFAFRELFKSELDSCRELNDYSTADDVLKNQGAIAVLKKLLKGTAQSQEQKVYDGAISE